MYDNRSQVRNLRVNLSVDEADYYLIKGMAMKNGRQMTAMWRELAVAKAMEIHEEYLAEMRFANRATNA
ncbi:hypothetical protein [Delftia sp. PE138]|uniref:hypothetical protein n=1 Tax=Delftia sp. PE138 TaxID=1812483 RepID=UPI001BB05141|nr:hypothetical protein [Delftia sp. PE138]MBS3723419.1 hypothetical protein [Delftia sp. PE138]